MTPGALDIHAARRWYLILDQLKAAQLEVARRNLHAVGRGIQ
jgi:hypothetical protein